ncbi:MAG: YraN family protein [Planctomycetaceae bacterium]|jgi:putative endonuclease|nr:YraN family protein [Planctomycetaceae bacterium]
MMMSLNLVRSPRPNRSFWKRVKKFLFDIFSCFSSDPLLRCRYFSVGEPRRVTSSKPKDILAQAGEDEAALFLQDIDYVILHRNVRFADGEIDIIAKDGSSLVFVEVKTRSSLKYGQPYEAINQKKQQRMHKLAIKFIRNLNLKKVNYRIDVISILWLKNLPPEIKHIKHAF